MADEQRYLVLRVPTSGPKALAGGENDFGSLKAAQARVADALRPITQAWRSWPTVATSARRWRLLVYSTETPQFPKNPQPSG